MIAEGVAVGQIRETPDKCRVEIIDVYSSKLYDRPRCIVSPLIRYPQPRKIYRADLSTSYVRKWKVIK